MVHWIFLWSRTNRPPLISSPAPKDKRKVKYPFFFLPSVRVLFSFLSFVYFFLLMFYFFFSTFLFIYLFWCLWKISIYFQILNCWSKISLNLVRAFGHFLHPWCIECQKSVVVTSFVSNHSAFFKLIKLTPHSQLLK